MTTLRNSGNATPKDCHRISDLSSDFTYNFDRNSSQIENPRFTGTTARLCFCEEKTLKFRKYLVFSISHTFLTWQSVINIDVF